MFALTAIATVGSGALGQEQRPRFQANVAVVRVDVIATDATGRFVDDLEIEEFVLYEDGVRQTLTQAQVVDLRAGDGTRQISLSSEIVGVDTVEVDARHGAFPGRGVARAEDFGAMIFLIDASRLGHWAQRRFTGAWKELAEATESYNAPKAVYLLDYVGRLHEIMALTLAPEAMLDAGDRLEEEMYLLGWRRSPPSDLPFPVAGVEDRAGAIRTFEILEALAASFSFRPGRKSIIWVSEGVPSVAYGAIAMIIPEVAEKLDELVRTANSANTSIYSVDPTLVTDRYKQNRSSRITSRVGPVDELLRDPFERRVARFDGLRDSLKNVAERTGGVAYPFTTRVGSALDEIRRDIERYYLLAYVRESARDGKYRELKVETTRKGVTIRARAGYTDYSRERLAYIRASSDLAFPEFSGTTELAFATYRSWTDEGDPRLQVAVDLGQLVLAEDARMDESRSFQLALAAIDSAGRVVDTVYKVVSWGSVAGGAARPSVYLHDWHLGYGSFEIRVALVDRSTLRAAAGRAPAELGDPGDGWRVSDPILLARNRTGVTEPVIRPDSEHRVLAGLYFECWKPGRPEVDAVLSGAAGGSALPVEVQELGEDRFRVFVSLAGAPAAQGGLVRIKLTNQSTGERRSFVIETGGSDF